MNLEQKIVINRNLSTNLGFLLCSDWSLGICYLHSLTLILEGLKIFQSFTEPFSVAKTTLHSQMSVRQSSKPLIFFIILNLSFIILHSSFLHFAAFKLFSLFQQFLVIQNWALQLKYGYPGTMKLFQQWLPKNTKKITICISSF